MTRQQLMAAYGPNAGAAYWDALQYCKTWRGKPEYPVVVKLLRIVFNPVRVRAGRKPIP
jgi:hypothetical protein